MRRVPTVEVHSWSRDKYDVTPYVRVLNVSPGVSQPWSQISVVLRIPVALWTKLVPRQADWLVVKDAGDKAIAWGYVAHRHNGITVSGQTVSAKDTTIQTIDWLEFLGRVEIYVAAGLIVQSTRTSYNTARKYGVLPSEPGTLLPMQRWADPDTGPWRALIAAARNYFSDGKGGQVHRPIGFALQEFVKTIARVMVPRTLSTQYLASQVRTVYDDTGTAAYAPARKAEAVPGFTLAGLNALQPQGTTVLGMLMQTFMPDFNLVECFSSLEDPGVLESSNDPVDRKLRDDPNKDYVPAYDVTQPPPLVTAGLGDTAVEELNERRDEEEATRTDEERYGRKLTSGLGEALGRNPVLIYRMKPWRATELGEFIKQAPAAADRVWLRDKGATEAGFLQERAPEQVRDGTYQKKMSAEHFDLGMFQGTTWRLDDAPVVTADALLDLDMTQDDLQHANTVTIGLPTQADHPMRFMQRLGLPFYSDEAILTRGVRLYQPQWPFFPPLDSRQLDNASVISGVVGPALGSAVNKAAELMSSGAMLKGMRTIALLGMQLMSGADRFESGDIDLDYSPHIVHGRPLRVGLPASFPGKSKELVCYVERVTHVWEVRKTSVVARTSVEYSRGLLDEGIRSDPIVFAGPGGVS